MGTNAKLYSPYYVLLLFLLICVQSCTNEKDPLVTIVPHSLILLIGNILGSRMLNFGRFETEMHLRYPSDSLFIRNMCDGGDTPGFRPHSGRENQIPKMASTLL